MSSAFCQLCLLFLLIFIPERGMLLLKERRKEMTQGERVKEVRKTLGLTLEKFGQKLGVTKAALSAIENGRRGLTEQMTISICREYNVNYDYLTYGDGEMFEDLPETILDELCIEYDLDDDDRDILNFYLGLPADARDAIKKQIKKIFVKE